MTTNKWDDRIQEKRLVLAAEDADQLGWAWYRRPKEGQEDMMIMKESEFEAMQAQILERVKEDAIAEVNRLSDLGETHKALIHACITQLKLKAIEARVPDWI